MVRRVRYCSNCQKRFISFSSSNDRCTDCKNAGGTGTNEFPTTTIVFDSDANATKISQRRVSHSPLAPSKQLPSFKRARTDDDVANSDGTIRKCGINEDQSVQILEEACPYSSTKNQKEILEICDDSSESGMSEGLDEELCTQLHEDGGSLFDESSHLDQEENDTGNVNVNEKEFSMDKGTDAVTIDEMASPERSSNANNHLNNALGNDEDICFICGSSFARITTGFHGRLNHMKRCAKKFGVSAQDFRINDDYEAFHSPAKELVQSDESPAQNKPARTVTNPYSARKKSITDGNNNKWHGDAGDDLKLAAKSAGATKQTSLTTYFKQPKRSVNSVLLANAKRLAKADHLNGQQKEQKTNGGNKGRKGGWSRWKPYDSTTCPAYKRITGTDFLCDGFKYPRASKNHFLSHFHSDHYGGITKDWKAGTIYCSLSTANLVHERLGVEREFLHPIPLNSPVVIASNGRPVTVTLFDANHCPGAVMFLFQIGKRSILHVGDFRWHREMMLSNQVLKALSIQQNGLCLDELFLDTTYLNPKHTLPKQDVAIQATVECAVREVKQAQSRQERLLMIFGAYTIGKERIFLAVAEKLGMKVYVDSQRLKVLSALEWPKERMSIFTTSKWETNLWVVELGHINMKKMPDYLYGLSKAKQPTRKFDRVVGFRPTGWTNRPGNSIITSKTSGCIVCHGVPYSEHSSFDELLDCVRTLKPKKIIPTVSAKNSQEQVTLILQSLKTKQAVLGF